MSETVLRPFQKKGVRRIYNFGGRALLADEMGLGKTIQALAFLHYWKEFTLPAVVVCPSSLKYNWEREALTKFGITSDVCEGRTPPYGWSPDRHRLTIINYDILPYWYPHIKRIKPNTIIVDEAHYTKNPTSMRSIATRRIARLASYVLCLTGTPLTNKPVELWTLMRMIRPDLYKKDDFDEFAWKHCDPKLRRGRWKFDGAKRLDELHVELKENMMIRRTKQQVLKELPPKTRTVVKLDIDNRKEYDEAENDFIGWLSSVSYTKAIKASRVETMAKIGYLKRLAAAGKMKAVFEWIDNFLEESTDKLVVFAWHKSIVKAIHERYKHTAVMVNGSVKGRKRQNAVDTFQKDPKCRVFVGNHQAAGVGLTLTASSTVAMVELPWTPADLNQAEDRTHRIGQVNAVNVYYLLARDTVERRLCQILRRKQRIIDQVVDGKVATTKDDIFELLTRKYTKDASRSMSA